MRLFVAIDIGEDIRKSLAVLQQKLEAKADIRKGDVKWVRPEAIHLTLKFLGHVADERAAEVCNIVKAAVSGHESFDLDIGSVGSFGGRSARVLWVGSGEGSDKLARLAEDIEQEFAKAGWAKENRKFTAHLTLCRIKNSRAGVKLAQIAENFKDFDAGLLSAESVCVYSSKLTSVGAEYTLLGNYKLQ